MPSPDVRKLIADADGDQLRETVFWLARDPLPFRKANYTRPGQDRSSLDDADDYLEGRLRGFGYEVEREACQAQAFRRDRKKPPSAQYSPPDPRDPWYTLNNLYAKRPGSELPDEIIVIVSHKDSQSWIDSPGANDNAIGTAGNLEAARLLASYEPARTLWFLFCNEEHTPWTSVAAARGAKERGDNIIAVLNLDGIGVKTREDAQAGRLVNLTGYCTPEGEALAELMARVNEAYDVGLVQRAFERPGPGDDDGSFVKAGYPAAAVNIGSYPYADPNYHLETDVPENCDCANAALAVRSTVAAVLALDVHGFPGVS